MLGALCAHPLLAALSTHDFPTVFDAWLMVPNRVLLRLERLLDEPPPGFDVDRALADALETTATTSVGPWGERHRLAAVEVSVPGQ